MLICFNGGCHEDIFGHCEGTPIKALFSILWCKIPCVNRLFMGLIRTPFWLVKSFKNPRIFQAAFSCAPMRQASLFAWQRLSQHHGLPSGSFGADDTWLNVSLLWWYPYVTYGGVQSIGVPPNHPVYFRIFHCKASSYWGTPMA